MDCQPNNSKQEATTNQALSTCIQPPTNTHTHTHTHTQKDKSILTDSDLTTWDTTQNIIHISFIPLRPIQLSKPLFDHAQRSKSKIEVLHSLDLFNKMQQPREFVAIAKRQWKCMHSNKIKYHLSCCHWQRTSKSHTRDILYIVVFEISDSFVVILSLLYSSLAREQILWFAYIRFIYKNSTSIFNIPSDSMQF